MNGSPMNYLITLAVGVVLWFVTAIVLGGVIGDSISLSSMSVEHFLVWYRVALGIATLCGIVNLCYWYYYGGKDSSAGEYDRSKLVWNFSFIAQIVIAIGLIVLLVIALLAEGIASGFFIAIFGFTSLHTWLLFWIFSLFMSPPNVQHIPLGKR